MTLPFNPFRIDWNDCTFGQWEALLARCKRPTLLQTWQYGVTMATVEGWKADFGIIHFEGKPVGLVLVQTRKWLPFLTACRIHRGPLWIYDEIPGEMLKLVLGMLRQRYQLRRGRLLMFHPELPDDPATRQRMSATGFWRWSEGYASVWPDLAPGPDALHAGLHGKWRNQLRQAERHNLVLETETSAGKRFDWLMEHYLEDKVARRYPGLSLAFLRAMHKCLGRQVAPGRATGPAWRRAGRRCPAGPAWAGGDVPGGLDERAGTRGAGPPPPSISSLFRPSYRKPKAISVAISRTPQRPSNRESCSWFILGA
ncbi:hypothetical protein JL100_000465 [Skermanella mucosa]|uniref:hypothetical protein n=1 Tax=Skermanella mucosa TaxID=1789672 RepID=UPI00192A77AC|nr:hypothetical protein [Skermanella mucosa]UEM21299.1 hypothetical protein JL100_000465 [Skermanella mucosa]